MAKMAEWRGRNGRMVECWDGGMAAEWRDCRMAVMATRMARMAEWSNDKNGGKMAAEWWNGQMAKMAEWQTEWQNGG
jgi:hypothetical protein